MKHFTFSNYNGQTIDIVATNLEAAKEKLKSKGYNITDWFLAQKQLLEQ